MENKQKDNLLALIITLIIVLIIISAVIFNMINMIIPTIEDTKYCQAKYSKDAFLSGMSTVVEPGYIGCCKYEFIDHKREIVCEIIKDTRT